MDTFLFILAGIAGGILAGMGMGGGTLLIPILTIFLSVSQHFSQAINLISFIPMAIVALIIHFKHKLIVFKTGLPILITGIIGAIIGAIIANNTKSEVLRVAFGIFLIIVGLYGLVCAIRFKNNKKVSAKKINNC